MSAISTFGNVFADEQDQFAHEFDPYNSDHIRAVVPYDLAEPILDLMNCLHTHGSESDFKKAAKEIRRAMRERWKEI